MSKKTIASKDAKVAKDGDTLSRKAEIIDVFVLLLAEKRMTPSRNDLREAGVSWDTIRHHFGTLMKLREATKIAHPSAFKNVIDESVLTPQFFRKVQDDAGRYKKFVVTTAVTGMPVHKDFYTNLKFYAAKNKAKLLVLTSSDPAAVGGFELDSTIDVDSLVLQNLELNSNITLSTFKTSAKQINPLTGLRRIGTREKSMIVASPKQFLEYVPIANDKMSHALMTTGAVTLPRYMSEHYMSQRTAWIANLDHKMGAIIVEIQDDQRFHMRQIQAEYATGYFIDQGVYYKLNKTQTVAPEALVLGDWHVGSTNTMVQKGTDKLLKKLKPKRVFLHDLFDGFSCNPHSMTSFLGRGMMGERLSLEFELKMVATEMNRLMDSHPYVQEWVVVRSNHDLFLDRYLDGGEYLRDATNHVLALELASAKARGENVLQYGISKYGAKNKKLRFLKINDSYKIAGIEHGQHGHLGLNGQRNPGNSSLEIAYGSGTFGHSHSPGILRDIFRTGTSTDMRIGYNNGASSWMNTHGTTYANGSRQLVNLIDGRFEK